MVLFGLYNVYTCVCCEFWVIIGFRLCIVKLNIDLGSYNVCTGVELEVEVVICVTSLLLIEV